MGNQWENPPVNKRQEEEKDVIKIDDIANYFYEEADRIRITNSKSSDKHMLKIADGYSEMANEMHNRNYNKALGEIERTIFAVKTSPETFPEESIDKLRNFASFLTAEIYKDKEKSGNSLAEFENMIKLDIVEAKRKNWDDIVTHCISILSDIENGNYQKANDYLEAQIASTQKDIEADGKTSRERELKLEKLRNTREFFRGIKK